jgi:hypothetical protein
MDADTEKNSVIRKKKNDIGRWISAFLRTPLKTWNGFSVWNGERQLAALSNRRGRHSADGTVLINSTPAVWWHCTQIGVRTIYIGIYPAWTSTRSVLVGLFIESIYARAPKRISGLWNIKIIALGNTILMLAVVHVRENQTNI